MTTLPLWLVTALYSLQAVVALRDGQPDKTTILTGYVIANLGLIWSMK